MKIEDRGIEAVPGSMEQNAQLRQRSRNVVEAIRGLRTRLRPAPTLVRILETLFSRSAILFLAFLGIFIIHQTFLWLSIHPNVAFERAKQIVYVVEVVYDSLSNIGNAGLDVVDTLVPLWNAASNVRFTPLPKKLRC